MTFANFRPSSGFIWVSLLVACGGCGAGSGGAGELYLQRLAGALGQEVPAILDDASAGLAVFPGGDSLRIKRAENKLKLKDTLEIHRCDLGSVVGARNGALGRVQTSSQRYLYDLKILAGLNACESASQGLVQLEQERRAELPISRFNALFNGDEWHDFVTPALVEPSAAADEGELVRTLSALAAALAASGETEELDWARVENFENLLGTLRFSRAFGEQRRRWRKQSIVLEAAAKLLDTARTENPGCRNGRPTEAGRIRLNIFQAYYVEGYQPLLAFEGQPDRGWLLQVAGILRGILSPIQAQPQAQEVADWHEQVLGAGAEDEFGRWKMAVHRHTQAWQWQLRTCGLLPSR